MLQIMGTFFIAFCIFIKLLTLIKSQAFKNKWLRNCSDYGFWDKILRIVQYLCLLGIAYAEGTTMKANHGASYQEDLFLNLKQIERTKYLVSVSRKVLRFIRGGLLFKILCNTKLTIRSLSKIQILTFFQSFFLFFSNLFDFIYYITDHYDSFQQMNLLSAEQQLTSSIQLLGNICWVACSALAIISIICTLQKNRVLAQQKGNFLKLKSVKIAIIDVFSNINQIGMGFCFIDPSLGQKKYVAMMALASTISKLSKLTIQ